MFCKVCGENLVKGMAFCMNCGTPVPAGADNEAPEKIVFKVDDENGFNINDLSGSDEGVMVFCPTCGTHMQKTPDKCVICGMVLLTNIHSENNTTPVPPFNPDNVGIGEAGGIDIGIGGGIEVIGGEGMASIGASGGMSAVGSSGGMESVGGGMASVGKNNGEPAANTTPETSDTSDNAKTDTPTSTEADQISGSAANNTPDISDKSDNSNTDTSTNTATSANADTDQKTTAPPVDIPTEKPVTVKQNEPEQGKERKVENFSMSGVIDGEDPLSDKTTPVIRGGSMEDDSTTDAELDPYKFLNNSMSDTPEEVPPNPTAAISEPTAASVAEPISEKAPELAAPNIKTEAEKTTEQTAAPVAVLIADAPPKEDPISNNIGAVPESKNENEPAKTEGSVQSAAALTFDPITPNTPSSDSNSGNSGSETRNNTEKAAETIVLNRADSTNKAFGNPAPKAAPLYCRNCGQDIDEKDTVCKHCGAPIADRYTPPPKKKKFPVFMVVGIAAIVAVIIALALFIKNKADENKIPISSDSNIGISDQSSSVNTSSDTSDVPPVQSTDNSSTSEDDPISSSEPENNSFDTSSEVSSSSSSTQSSTKPSQSSSSTTKSSSTPQSTPKPQSSSSAQSSSQQPEMTAKVKSLEEDRVRIMNAVSFLTGEMGKADMFVRCATYELENSNSPKVVVLQNFFDSDLGKALSTSLQSNRLTAVTISANAAPKNSEMNGIYQTLDTLVKNYTNCLNVILSTNNANQYITNAANTVNMFNSTLSSMGFNKFTASNYTASDKEQVYASILRLAQTQLNSAVDGLTPINNAIYKLGSVLFDTNAPSRIANNASSYIKAAEAMGRINAYRIILLGVQNKYSSVYSEISAGYNSITTIFRAFMDIKNMSFDDYNKTVNQNIAFIQMNAIKINNAIK